MANEITVDARLRVVKALVTDEKVLRSATFDMAGDNLTSQVQLIGTSHESLAIVSDIAIAGYAWFRNVDATNFIEIGLEVAAAFQPLIKLKSGEVAVLRLATTSVFARANTAAVNLQFLVLED